jgi:hypothetical protein
MLEGLSQLKNPMTLSEIEPATFRLVAWLKKYHTIHSELKNRATINASSTDRTVGLTSLVITELLTKRTDTKYVRHNVMITPHTNQAG